MMPQLSLWQSHVWFEFVHDFRQIKPPDRESCNKKGLLFGDSFSVINEKYPRAKICNAYKGAGRNEELW